MDSEQEIQWNQRSTLATPAPLLGLRTASYCTKNDGTPIRRLAIALGTSADMLVFDEKERSPSETLRYQFETVSRLSEHEQEVVRELLDAVIIKNQVAGALERVAKPLAKVKSTPVPTKPKRAAHANVR